MTNRDTTMSPNSDTTLVSRTSESRVRDQFNLLNLQIPEGLDEKESGHLRGVLRMLVDADAQDREKLLVGQIWAMGQELKFLDESQRGSCVLVLKEWKERL